MAITATLVFTGHNRLRYFISSLDGAGESVEIPCVGGATPDLLTDSLAGPIKQIARVKAQGYGLIAIGGVTTQAQARALWLSDNALTLVGPNMSTAICRFEQLSGDQKKFRIDAIQGSGDAATPSIQITAMGDATDASGFLEIEIPGSIGA